MFNMAKQSDGYAMNQSSANRMLRGELRLDEPMAKHTSWRTGGTADRFYIPADKEDLAMFFSQTATDENIVWIGLGSNLLVRDGGIRGTVIAVKNVIDELQDLSDRVIKVGAGTPCAKVARFSVKCGYSGMEFLAGIPGTMGGALAMNAGAYGSETWQRVTEVETIDREGNFMYRSPSDFRIAYRTVQAEFNEWFLSAHLQLEQTPNIDSEELIRKLLAKRAEAQPMGEHSCGSVFRNPENDYAGRLIEVSGLKEKQIGGAQISAKHANFIINNGNATATDIEELISYVQNTVEQKQGVCLQTEVRIIGERN